MAGSNLIIAAAQSASAAGDISQNIARHLQFGASAATQGVQLLIFPELSLTGYELNLARSNSLYPASPDLEPLRELARQARMIVVAGAPLRNEQDKLHIAAFAFHPDGAVSTYTKEHVHKSEQAIFASGPGGAALKVEDTKVALAICADATHPQHAAGAAARGAYVYAVGAMIDQPGYTRKAELLQRYAREHRMTVLLANYSGVTGGDQSAGKSAIWSEDGTVVAACEGHEEALVIGRRENGVWSGICVPVH